MLRKLLVVLLLLGLAGPALATTTGTYTPAVSGTLTDRSNTGIAQSAVQVMAANNGRKYFVIQNESANVVTCGLNSSVTAGNGIQLPQYWSWTSETNFIYSGAIYCVSSAGTNTVTAYEG